MLRILILGFFVGLVLGLPFFFKARALSLLLSLYGTFCSVSSVSSFPSLFLLLSLSPSPLSPCHFLSEEFQA